MPHDTITVQIYMQLSHDLNAFLIEISVCFSEKVPKLRMTHDAEIRRREVGTYRSSRQALKLLNKAKVLDYF